MINLTVTYKKFVYAAAIITGCCFVCSCENDQKEIDAMTKNVTTKEEAINVESFLSQSGKMRAKLKAPLMIRTTKDTIIVEFPHTLHVDFYNDSTKIESWVDSKHGKYFESLNKVYLWDSVIVINIKGDTLKTQDLWWDQNTKLFFTDKYAEYHTKDKNIHGGKGMEATQDFTRVTFKYPTGTFQVADDGLPKQ